MLCNGIRADVHAVAAILFIYASVERFTELRIIEKMIRCMDVSVLSAFCPHMSSPAMAAEMHMRSSSLRELIVFITSSVITNVLLMAIVFSSLMMQRYYVLCAVCMHMFTK